MHVAVLYCLMWYIVCARRFIHSRQLNCKRELARDAAFECWHFVTRFISITVSLLHKQWLFLPWSVIQKHVNGLSVAQVR
uniref:Secreted protein n=1 Tax=Rhipicephalus appendiculatus TaxID=34631 RepID=A0A131YAE8_RHIAP